MPLTAVAINGFTLGKPIMPNSLKNIEKTDNISGAKIARAVRRQATVLISIQDWRIMRGFGTSIKSAPLKPMFNETALKANVRNKPFNIAMLIIVGVGL